MNHALNSMNLALSSSPQQPSKRQDQEQGEAAAAHKGRSPRGIAILFSPGPFGGAEQVVLTSSRSLEGIELWIIQESRNPNPSIEFQKRCAEVGIETKVFVCHSQFDRSMLGDLIREVKQQDIKLIHSHGMKANFYNSMLPAKRIATQHGKTSHNFKVRVLEWIEHLALKRMDQVVCVSKKMFDESNYKHRVLIENFLSVETEKKHYTPEGELKLVCIGRLSFEKGIADLIHALKMIPDENVSLTVVGDGNQMADLKEISSSMSNVRFEGFQKDIRNYLVEADALVMPSHREGLPMTLIEATAAGLPIIASKVGGIPNLVHENGYLFEPQNIDDIKNAIIVFKKNRRALNEAAKAYRETIRETYSLSHWLMKTNQLYANFA